MASNTAVKMDVDNPLVLKRSSSAPMINELNNSISTQAPSNPLRSVMFNLKRIKSDLNEVNQQFKWLFL